VEGIVAKTTPEQQIAALEAKLARAKEQVRARETRAKIIVGAAMVGAAETDPKIAGWMATKLREVVKREPDVEAVKFVLEKLDAVAKAAGSAATNRETA
jgi:hypothetical protein